MSSRATGGAGILTSATGVTIVHNLVGTDGTGLLDRGNTLYGIHVSGSTTVIGGAGAGNTIAGNGSDGIQISVGGPINTRIQGNRIGVGVDGSTALGNGLRGVGVFGPEQVLIGGTGAGEGNIIANQAAEGVAVTSSADDVAILGNSLYANGGLGIDLVADGVTANDSGDADTGPNGRLNFPVLYSAEDNGGLVTLTWALDAPAGSYRLEVFTNASGVDPSGYGEGRTVVDTRTVSHPGGSASYTATFNGAAGDVLTATVTEILGVSSYGASSEFSAAATVTEASAELAYDASGRRSDLRAAGGLTLTPPRTGVAGPGFDLAGGTRRLVGPATDVTSGALTLSAWVQRDTAGTAPRILARTTAAGTAIYELLIDDATGELVGQLLVGGSPVEVRGGTVPTGAWRFAAMTWNGTVATLYLDGVMVDIEAAAGALGTDRAAPLVVGNRAAADRALDGGLDQLQVVHTARSGAWLATVTANVTQTSAFVTLGAVQTQNAGTWTTSGAHAHSGVAALAAPTTPATGADAWAVATGIDEPGVEFESWWRVSDLAALEAAVGTRTGTLAITQYETALTASGFDLATLIGATRSTAAAPTAPLNPLTWTRVTFRTDETGATTVLVGGTPVRGPASLSGRPARGSVGFRVGELPPGQSWFIDDVQLRRYVSDEPATTVGPLDRN